MSAEVLAAWISITIVWLVLVDLVIMLLVHPYSDECSVRMGMPGPHRHVAPRWIQLVHTGQRYSIVALNLVMALLYVTALDSPLMAFVRIAVSGMWVLLHCRWCYDDNGGPGFRERIFKATQRLKELAAACKPQRAPQGVPA